MKISSISSCVVSLASLVPNSSTNVPCLSMLGLMSSSKEGMRINSLKVSLMLRSLGAELLMNRKVASWNMTSLETIARIYVLKLVVCNYFFFNKVVIDNLNTIILKPIN